MTHPNQDTLNRDGMGKGQAPRTPQNNEVKLWRGKNVNDMTKAELIDALTETNELREQDRKWHLHALDVLGGSGGESPAHSKSRKAFRGNEK